MTPPIFVFDMEWTTWEGAQARGWSGPGETMEVVQIGAIRLERDTNGLAETAALSLLIRPRINFILSAYFIDLTGITQAELDAGGVPLAQALDAFTRFVGDDGAIWSNGGDETILQANCHLEGLTLALEENRFQDGHPLLIASTGLPSAQLVSADLPALMGTAAPADGRRHDALDDARALAGALARIGAFGPPCGLTFTT
ncbi:inhibitor of the KinA pathway to sporulation [Paramagnetospirillum caucaseum]|uniref:Inhibitor of the KinA pathway to sporulation n=1 Tax=Paramagnetospirillum caucaseum TaxID=1244869 RepID=M3A952_9PROT|nr:3'-5' exonuclease [Paramagnetospirillum caucaseum]EME69313.1 inhibitor of the KinA pathway to sporulation [Paramagnetospirillum caucaseum]